MTLPEIVGNDIRHWLETTTEFFTNERDLQVRLAIFLATECGYRVHTEYRIPLAELKAKGLPVEDDTKLAAELTPDPISPGTTRWPSISWLKKMAASSRLSSSTPPAKST